MIFAGYLEQGLLVRKPHLLWKNYFNSRYFPLNVIRCFILQIHASLNPFNIRLEELFWREKKTPSKCQIFLKSPREPTLSQQITLNS